MAGDDRGVTMRGRPISSVLRRAVVALAAVLVALPLIAARADAFVYWSIDPGAGGGRIGKANNTGGIVTNTLMSGLFGAQAVAVAGGYIYWANGPNQIGKATLDGTVVEANFVSGIFSANAIAVDPVNGYLFWADLDSARIGRANLADGSGVNLSLVSTLNKATGLAVDSAPRPSTGR
jgi:hypothetical protein